MNSVPIPRTTKATCRMEAAGGVRKESGASSDLLVAVTLTVTIPGPELFGVTVQALTLAIQRRSTPPFGLNPPSPLTVTGKVVATPLGTLTAPLGPVKRSPRQFQLAIQIVGCRCVVSDRDRSGVRARCGRRRRIKRDHQRARHSSGCDGDREHAAAGVRGDGEVGIGGTIPR